jgi:hypothetical protein
VVVREAKTERKISVIADKIGDPDPCTNSDIYSPDPLSQGNSGSSPKSGRVQVNLITTSVCGCNETLAVMNEEYQEGNN